MDSTRKELDEFRAGTVKANETAQADTQKKIDDAVMAYEEGIEAAKKKMQTELEACEKQLSEKAKKQMIDYINQSLNHLSTNSDRVS